MATLVTDKIAGSYSASWNGTNLGHTDTNGFTMVRQCQWEPVEADAFGRGTVVDHIKLGERVTIQATFIQRSLAALQTFLHPWHAEEGVLAVPGTHVCGVESAELVLTPRFAASLAGQAGWVYTFPEVVIDPSQLAEMMNSQLRRVRVTMHAYPYSDEGVIRLYEKAVA